jgi:hypothetical protein
MKRAVPVSLLSSTLLGLSLAGVSLVIAPPAAYAQKEASATRYAKSVFTLVTSKGTATSFALPDRRMVTVYRMIDGADAAGARQPAGQPDIALDYLMAYDKQSDFAVLNIPITPTITIEPLKVGASTKLKVGDKLTAVVSKSGNLTSVPTTVHAKRDVEGVEYFQLSTPLPAESEGGPLLNDKGEVVGMITGSLPAVKEITFALGIETVLGRSRGIPLQALIPVPASQGVFARLNGDAISNEDYLRSLERQGVTLPGGQTINAERLVIDQLIGNRLMLTEAGKLDVMPSSSEVDSFFSVQKKFYETQNPGKNYEDSMRTQGTTPEEIKSDLRMQLAETNVYAKRLPITDEEVTKAYENAKGQFGIPHRAQLRLILAVPNSTDFNEVKKQLAEQKPFEDVAKIINPPQLKATAGLLPQPTPLNQIAANLQGLVLQSAEGAVLGPVDFSSPGPNQPAMKAWVRIEKKYPGVAFSVNEATPLIRRQLVQQKLTQPDGAKIRFEYLQKKLDAKFEPSDPSNGAVWESIKQAGREMGAGAAAPVPAPAPQP